MKPARFALWMPCVLAAVGLHALGGALAFSGSPTAPAPAATEDWHFCMRRTASAGWHDGVTDPSFIPHEELELFSRGVACSFWKETVDGVEVSKSRCHYYFSDAFEDRWRFEREIAAEHLTHSWAGTYFRGFEFSSGALLTLSPSGGAWGRSCSASDGVGVGRVGSVEQGADGMLHVSPGGEAAPELIFFPVRWGERLYLVEPELVDEFLLLVRTGVEPRASRYGRFFLREGDENWEVDGEPQIGLPQR